MADFENKDFDPKAAAEARKAEMAGMNEQIEQRLKEIFSGERFKEYLEFCSRLPRYSVNNQLLIMTQKPNAVMCQSFEKWKDAGRFVKKGEKGIRIMAPYKYKDITAFKPSSIFDISQTDGDTKPFIGGPDLSDDQVKGMNDLIRELNSKELKDFEKASAAFIASAYFRQDTQEVPIDSVKDWAMGKDNVDLRSSLEVIRRAASDIISRVEEKMENRDVDKEIQEFVSEYGDELPFDVNPGKNSVIADLAKNKECADAEKSENKGITSTDRGAI